MRTRERKPLPPPLPPETRTVGQLVAESIRLYARRFWVSLGLGIGPSAVAVVVPELGRWRGLAFAVAVAPLVMTISYVGASAIVAGRRPSRQTILTALLVGIIVYLPVPILSLGLVLPAVAWLAFVGLAVPAAVIENLRVREAISRGFALGRADFTHALGSLATLVIVVFVAGQALLLLIIGWSGQARTIASFLASLILFPLLFLGGALLYFDQAARVSSGPRRERSRDAHVSHAVDVDRSGPADAAVESRPAARGQP